MENWVPVVPSVIANRPGHQPTSITPIPISPCWVVTATSAVRPVTSTTGSTSRQRAASIAILAKTDTWGHLAANVMIVMKRSPGPTPGSTIRGTRNSHSEHGIVKLIAQLATAKKSTSNCQRIVRPVIGLTTSTVAQMASTAGSVTRNKAGAPRNLIIVLIQTFPCLAHIGTLPVKVVI